MILSDFGKKLTAKSGILQLMDDLGKPLPKGVPVYRLGGGNPARVPEMEEAFRAEITALLQNEDSFEKAIALYDAPQGKQAFLDALVELFNANFGWNIRSENIMLTNGSQTALFYFFNLFGGTVTDQNGKQTKQKIVFPLVPEYIGYADQGIEKDTFVGIPARCEFYKDNTFKYFIDFSALESYLASNNDTGALCVSRPTNPTGNVLTNEEMILLNSLAQKYNIPLFVDNAYGMPFPHIVFVEDAKPFLTENTVLGMSLSKLGLPSLRCGIVIAQKEIIEKMSAINAIASLAPTGFGPTLVLEMIKNHSLLNLSQKTIKPYYASKSIQAQQWIHEFFAGTEYSIHKSEGALFLWLYLADLQITTIDFYAKLKERGVITVPGEYFFFGLPEGQKHEHFDKCLRLNYSGSESEVREGLHIISELYRQYS